MSYAQKFYLLKIYLNLFEISNRVLKFGNVIYIWKSFILSEYLFQTWTRQNGAMCVFQVHHVVRLNTFLYTTGSMFEIDFQTGQTFFRFRLNFKIAKLYLRFQINSNRFSRDRSFGHYWENFHFSNFQTVFEISNIFKRIFKR